MSRTPNYLPQPLLPSLHKQFQRRYAVVYDEWTGQYWMERVVSNMTESDAVDLYDRLEHGAAGISTRNVRIRAND